MQPARSAQSARARLALVLLAPPGLTMMAARYLLQPVVVLFVALMPRSNQLRRVELRTPSAHQRRPPLAH